MPNTDTMAKAFGANVKLAMPGQALYLIIGYDESVDGVVRAVGGEVVFTLPERRVYLAVLSVEAYFALQAHPRVSHIGPVSVDSDRFNQFLRLIQMQMQNGNQDSQPGDTG